MPSDATPTGPSDRGLNLIAGALLALQVVILIGMGVLLYRVDALQERSDNMSGQISNIEP